MYLKYIIYQFQKKLHPGIFTRVFYYRSIHIIIKFILMKYQESFDTIYPSSCKQFLLNELQRKSNSKVVYCRYLNLSYNLYSYLSFRRKSQYKRFLFFSSPFGLQRPLTNKIIFLCPDEMRTFTMTKQIFRRRKLKIEMFH